MKVKLGEQVTSRPSLALKVLDFFNSEISSTEYNPFKAAAKFVALNGINLSNISVEDLETQLSVLILPNVVIGTNSEKFSDEQYNLYHKLSLLIHYIERIVIYGYTEEFKGLTRMAVPPLEVYKYVGHNKVDIRQNEKDYALLFEH